MKLIIFDLRETLIFYKGRGLNWKEHYETALKDAFKAVNYPYSDEEMKWCLEVLTFYNTREHHRIFEVKESEVLQRVAGVCQRPIHWQPFECAFFNYFQRQAKQEETARETLRYLRKNNCRLAVLSDAAYGMPKSLLEKDLGDLKNLFDEIYSSTDIGFRKPHPKGIERLVSEFGVRRDAVIFVGNEKKDIETATNYGVRSLLLSRSGEKKNFGQTATIKSLSEIEQFMA